VPARLHALHATNRSAIAGTHRTHRTHCAHRARADSNLSSTRRANTTRNISSARTGAHGGMPQHHHR
jgi:hypothetical protein